jgi:hypothetical protein
MSVILYLLGILSVLAGAAAVLLGLPVKEFSFGNTLIIAGTTGVVGGLIVIGLGAAVSQLQRVVEMLGARPLSRSGQPFEGVRIGSGPGRVPFPPKPKSEPRGAEMPVAPAVGDSEPEFPAPSLRNPDVPLMAEEEADELPLSPRDNAAARGERHPPMPEPADEPPEQPSFEPQWRSPPPPPRASEPTPFDKMWPPAERSPPPLPEADEPPPSRAESIPRASVEPAQSAPAEEPYNEPYNEPHDEPRDEPEQPVAILKSGVVDGMGYTLYVDGSIEAELPDGTLRFASINELRLHLERNA